VPINVFQVHPNDFSNIKSITLSTLNLVHQVGGLTTSEGDNEIGYVHIRAIKWLGGNMGGSHFAAGSVTREGSLGGGKGMRTKADINEVWQKLGNLQKLTAGGFY
jgi:hypothetical protein